MEGYSVTEAASVLGVPTERVWELLARGVLSGVPDGETGMRVFLQPRPAPPAVEEPRRSNGGGSSREPEAEASPFRELLSEFRNLTERYGQALLALGESRGEVASLRSRVDLLEARFDLRLPMSGPMTAPPPAAAGWNPRVARPMGETPSSADDAAGASPDHDDAEPSPPRRRRRGQHRATDDFAEALARAEDPSPAELPGGEEAAAAFAALRDEAAHRTAEHADAALPRELPAAEPIATIEPDDLAEDVREPIAMSPAVEAEAAVVEEAPEPISESLPAPAVEAEAVDEEAETVVDKAETVVDAVPAPIPEAQPLPPVEPQIVFDGLPLESEPEPESEIAAESEPEPEFAAESEPEFAGEPEPEREFAAEPEPELDRWAEPETTPEPEPEPAAEVEPYAEPVVEAPSSEAEPEALVEAHPEPVAEAPPGTLAEAEVAPEPEPVAVAESVEAEPEGVAEAHDESLADSARAVEPEPDPEVEHEPEVEAEFESVADMASAPMLEAGSESADEVGGEVAEADRVAPHPIEPEPVTATPADEEPEEPADAEPADAEPAWGQAARAEPALETEAESEPAPPGTEPEDVADSELSWDRDRYTAQIGEPDWIPEEREAQASAPATAPPVADGPSADAPLAAADTEDSDSEAASMPEPPWTDEPDRSTPTGEETMLWFGREPNRAAPAWPAEDDSAAEMEVASTGGHAARSRTVPEDPIGLRQVPAVPRVDPPDIRAEYRATLAGPQPPSPASRAYRRLRRIFPG